MLNRRQRQMCIRDREITAEKDHNEKKAALKKNNGAIGLLNHRKGWISRATKGVAEANGWHWLAPWISGQGTHHVNEANGVTSTFDPLTPTMLMFDGNGPSAPLTGMVWGVESGHMPPDGFDGLNDHWHFHEWLCYTDSSLSFIVGDGLTDAQCASRTGGEGINVDSSATWLLHVWLPVYDGWYATDIFNKEHPGI